MCDICILRFFACIKFFHCQFRTLAVECKGAYLINIQNSDSFVIFTWWRHQMETFSALLALCAGNSPVSGEFLAQRPVTRSFDVFFDLRPNKQLSKQSWGWWFETLSRPFWRHRNDHCVLPSHALPGIKWTVLYLRYWNNGHNFDSI